VKKRLLLEDLLQQAAKLEAFVYNFKNDNEEYIKIIKSIENKVHDSLSDKKRPLQLAENKINKNELKNIYRSCSNRSKKLLVIQK
jgi:hypothetical protein